MQQECRWHFDELIDCRIFNNPDLDRRLTKHIGAHPQIIADLLGDARNINICFRQAAQALSRNAGRVVPKTRLVIGIFCKSGTHRSVAMTLLLTSVLRNSGVQVDGAQYWSQWYWQAAKCQPQCRECQFRLSDSSATRALNAWRAL